MFNKKINNENAPRTGVRVYIFGNPLLPFDSLPIKLAPRLQAALPEFEFIIADPNENLKPENKELVIIDTIEGIDEVVIIDDIDKIKTEKIYSLHDFDLGYNLKLLTKLGELEKVTILGVPMEGDEEKIFEQLKKKMLG
jgi:Ni,Fe-hydrogenase maturation factor